MGSRCTYIETYDIIRYIDYADMLHIIGIPKPESKSYHLVWLLGSLVMLNCQVYISVSIHQITTEMSCAGSSTVAGCTHHQGEWNGY